MITTDDEEVIYMVETVDKVKPAPVEMPLMAYGKMIDDHTINLLVVGLEEEGTNVKIKRVADDKLVYEEIVEQAEGFSKNFKLKGLEATNIYFEITDAKGRSRTIYF
jgi:hypothetical protein